MARRAKAATGMELLDTLSAETDEILIHTVHRADRDDATPESLQAMNMALEFLRRSIAERRAILTGHAAPRAARVSA
jgi:hypothetical protein